jgi:hypothetical protein
LISSELNHICHKQIAFYDVIRVPRPAVVTDQMAFEFCNMTSPNVLFSHWFSKNIIEKECQISHENLIMIAY